MRKVIKPTSDTWIFLLPDEGFCSSAKLQNDLDIVALRHSGCGKKSMFLFNKENSVHEVLSFGEPKRSWFINNTVVSNGNLYLSTQIDPVFLVLPYLQQHCSIQAAPLDQILKDEDFPEIVRLLKYCSSQQLDLVADRKGAIDLNAYKYNEDKALLWLSKKVEVVVEILKQKKLHVGLGAISATYVKSEKIDNGTPDEEYKKYAFGIVTEYISEDLTNALQKYMGISVETENHKRKSSAAEHNNSKKVKMEGQDRFNSELSNYLIGEKNEKPKAPSAKEKAWVKAASGTKNISSFFRKK